MLRLHKTNFFILLFSLLFISTQLGFSQPNLQYSLEYMEGGTFVSQINEGSLDVRYDESKKRWDVLYITDSYEYTYQAKDDFSLLYYRGTYSDPAFIEYIRGYQEKEIIRQDNGSYLFRFKKNTDRLRERTIPPNDWAIASETTLIYFQMQLEGWNNVQENNEVTCFLAPYPLSDMAYRIERVLLSSLDDEINLFELPAFFSDFLSEDREIILVTGTLKGFAHALQPFPFYFAYDTKPPYLPVAAWGGIPGKEDYFAVYYPQ